MVETRARLSNAISGGLFLTLILISMVFGAVTGRRRLAGGRADWRGGVRLATFVVLAEMLRWAVIAHHTGEPQKEFDSFAVSAGLGLLQACFLFFLYLAVEPLVRRNTPELLIGWTRMLHGRFRDPRVARDVLVGAVFGTAGLLLVYVVNALPAWVPFHGQTPIPPNYWALAGGRMLLGSLVSASGQILIPMFALFGGWFLLRILLRKPLLAAIGLVVILTGLGLGGENPVLEIPSALLYGTLMAWLITRYGLLALVASQVVRWLVLITPLPLAPSSPYAFPSAVCLLVALLFAGWAFRTSLGGRPVFAFAHDD